MTDFIRVILELEESSYLLGKIEYWQEAYASNIGDWEVVKESNWEVGTSISCSGHVFHIMRAFSRESPTALFFIIIHV